MRTLSTGRRAPGDLPESLAPVTMRTLDHKERRDGRFEKIEDKNTYTIGGVSMRVVNTCFSDQKDPRHLLTNSAGDKKGRARSMSPM